MGKYGQRGRRVRIEASKRLVMMDEEVRGTVNVEEDEEGSQES